ncbi:MAG: hypothetical protein QOF37_447 [Thermoleophilaceae bacterium]|nr:hypothetical protein [Thermoleophilaceae bacterium]
MTATLGSCLRTTLPGGAPSSWIARAALADHFGDDLEDESLATLKLLSSEVVNNCVQHAGAGAGVLIEMRAWALSGCVHVEISTAAPPFRRANVPPRRGTDCGRGLHLVEQLSRSWGIVDHGRNTVWFKVDLAGAEA